MLANKVCGCSIVFISRLMGSAIDSTGYTKPFKSHLADYLPAHPLSWAREAGRVLIGRFLMIMPTLLAIKYDDLQTLFEYQVLTLCAVADPRAPEPCT